MDMSSISTESLLQSAEQAMFKSDKALANLARWLEERQSYSSSGRLLADMTLALGKIRSEQARRVKLYQRVREAQPC